ncbi:MAG: alpha-amylase, partial [Bacteroidota bacterium]
YENGLPEIYQLPLAFATEPLSSNLIENCHDAIMARLRIKGEDSLLYDALFAYDFQQAIIINMANHEHILQHSNEVYFSGNGILKNSLDIQDKIKPKILSIQRNNMAIAFNNLFFLKVYRQIDRSINPDAEISHFLTTYTGFQFAPKFLGTIEWKSDIGSLVLGMLQNMVESNSDAWTFILDKLDIFNERILSHSAILPPPSAEPIGSLLSPVPYESIPADIKEFIDGTTAELIHLLGSRTGEMHQALASRTDIADFKPEDYSLHYQRSLFAGFQSLVRGSFQNLNRSIKNLPAEIVEEATYVLSMKEDILAAFRKIYEHKITVSRIRIHGDFQLSRVLFTGKDVVITDFEGEPMRSFSERRLKRSALRDTASMVRSFHYAAFASLFLDNQIRNEDFDKLIPFLDQWAHYISSIFMDSYLEAVKNTTLIPKNKSDAQILINAFLLEKMLHELNYEISHRPNWAIIPLRGIKAILKKDARPPFVEDKIHLPL